MTMNNYDVKSVRDAAILTTSYVVGDLIKEMKQNNQLVLDVAFTKGSATSAQIKVEFSDDDTNFYQESSSSVLAGTDSITLMVRELVASGNYAINIPIKTSTIRISVKGVGTMTGSSMAIKAQVGQV